MEFCGLGGKEDLEGDGKKKNHDQNILYETTFQ